MQRKARGVPFGHSKQATSNAARYTLENGILCFNVDPAAEPARSDGAVKRLRRETASAA